MDPDAIPEAVEVARLHFASGANPVYIAVSDDGTVQISSTPPARPFVAARTIDQVQRFVSELRRRYRPV